MTYALRDGVSYCVVDGRFLFLDLEADRYYCLTTEGAAAFDRLRRRKGDVADRLRLNDCPVLSQVATAGGLAPCSLREGASQSVADARGTPLSWIEVVAAARCLAKMSARLRWRGLAGVVEDFARQKDRCGETGKLVQVERVATAFRRCGMLFDLRERCLVHSLAVAHRLLHQGVKPELVLGVKLGPFEAHAWVQWRGQLVNERPDVARLFTPILVA